MDAARGEGWARARARWAGLAPGARDLLVAVGITTVWAVIGAVGLATGYWSPNWIVSTWLCMAALAVAVAGWRTWPGPAFWMVTLAYPILYRTGLQTELHLVPVLVAAFAGTRRGAVGPVLGGLVAAVGTVLLTIRGGLALVEGPGAIPLVWQLMSRPSAMATLASLAVAAASVGTLVHRLERTTDELAARNAELRRLGAVQAEQAVLTERTRIARELHDVVAHHVSAIVVQAQAATRVADRNPEAPLEATRWIAGAGKEALTAMRGVVSVLRAEGPAELTPTVRLADIEAAAERVRAAGVAVDVHLPARAGVGAPGGGGADGGAARELPPDVVLAAVRITQEALTNVLLHSSASRVRVTLVERGDALRLTVEDPGPARGDGTARSGHGLMHMAERARACGGSVTAGPAGTGPAASGPAVSGAAGTGPSGWTVQAVLPLHTEVREAIGAWASADARAVQAARDVAAVRERGPAWA